MATKLMHCQTCPVLGAVHGLVLIGRFRLTFSLPSSRSRVDAGRWGRSQVYEGLLGSVQDGTVAALSAAPPCLLCLRSEVLGSESACRPGPAPDVLAQQG